MKRFVVSKTSLFDNVVRMEIVYAESYVEALYQLLELEGFLVNLETATPEYLKSLAWDGDMLIEALEI